MPEGSVILDEVTDVIHLPGFSSPGVLSSRTIKKLLQDENLISSKVISQLSEFVAVVANAYHSNPFHCLQHASQVTMGVTKLLSRIVVDDHLDDVSEEEDEEDSSSSSSDDEASDSPSKEEKVADDNDKPKSTSVNVNVVNVDPNTMASHLHNHTYGITSDPLCQFALVLGAFVHAVDHKGVSNTQLLIEEKEEAAKYKNRSITEQRSLDKIWKKLMEPKFVDLRKCIYCDVSELKRFRQVLVNSVLATDIDDTELQHLRMERWERTFQSRNGVSIQPLTSEDVHRKATIVLEHLMQTADIFHYMQSWIIYEKWSSRSFEEEYRISLR